MVGLHFLAACTVFLGAGCLKIDGGDKGQTRAVSDHEIQVDAMRAEHARARDGDPRAILKWASTVTAVHRNGLQSRFEGVDWDAVADEALVWLDRLEHESEELGHAVEAMRAKAHLLAARKGEAETIALIDRKLARIKDYLDGMEALEAHASLHVPVDHLDNVCERTRRLAHSDAEIHELIDVCRELNPAHPEVGAIPWVSEADRGAWERIEADTAGMAAFRRDREFWREARQRDPETLVEQYR